MTPDVSKLRTFIEALQRKCEVADRQAMLRPALEILDDVDRRARAFGVEVPLEVQRELLTEVSKWPSP